MGRPVPHLIVDLLPTDRLWQHDGCDQLVWLKRRLDMRRVAGETVKLGDGNDALASVRLDSLDFRVERPHCNGHIARVCGDAGLAPSDDGERARVAADRRTAAAG